MDYISVTEYARKYGVSERTARNYCESGKIGGAFLTGKTWNIPGDAGLPGRKAYGNREFPLLRILKEQKDMGLKGSIYHRTQIDLTYNSNHIEGSRLTHDQTRFIFETNTIGITGDSVNVDDIVETLNHFRCIDYIIDNASERLTEGFIKHLHLLLKSGTTDSNKDYNYVKKKTFEDILDFHVRFERIHPFQDGNGRVGRLVMFKECLANGIVPFIITDELKMFYYRGLNEWGHINGYLTDTCLTAQDQYKVILEKLDIRI